MRSNATQSHSESMDSSGLAKRFQQARESMRQLDDALCSLGSPRNPEKRTDRAPTPVPTTPIFNPTKLSY